MPSADKRARKKENARAAREEREAALRRKKRLRSSVTVGIVVAIFVGVIVLLNVIGGKDSKKKTTAASTTTLPNHLPAGCSSKVPEQSKKTQYTESPPFTLTDSLNYFAHVDTSCGVFDMNLRATDAPKAVNSFVFLAKNHFYDGLKWWRVAKDFVIQSGDPLNNGKGDAGYKLPTEAPPDGYHKDSIGMANAGNANSTSSQFFVILTDAGAKRLNVQPYQYTNIGDVIKGKDVVEKLGSMYSADADPDVPSTQTPRIPIYVNKVTIYTQNK
jgi:cyclophilin family peptidyl-prolyl cis-trans isomerase